MDTTKLRVELTICGAFYLLSFLFICMKIFGITNFSFIAALKDYLVFISIVVLAVSYILGIVFHSVVNKFFTPIARLLELLLRKKETLIYDRGNRHIEAKYIAIHQHGSDKLIELLESQKRDTNLLKNLILAIPFLGISYLIWALEVNGPLMSFYILILALILDILVLLAYIRQRKYYFRTIDMSYEEINKLIERTENKKKK